MIPKIIHYCWFGRNPKPELALKCIKSWKKYCKGYQIIEWNEDNFDINSAPLYVRQAYEAKKWAFVTDYVRLYAMTKFGGIYMDTDVEVLKPLDHLLKHAAFSGFENDTQIPTGIMACRKGFPLFEQFLAYYDNVEFINPDGTLNYTTNVMVMTEICLERGLKQNNQYQEIEGFALYPNDVFCPVDYSTNHLRKTKNTITIHWFSGSWQPKEIHERRQKWKMERERLERMARIDDIIHIPNRIAISILGKDRYGRIKGFLKESK